MKAFVFLLLLCTVAANAAAPDPARTRAYIDHAWDTLTRSMDDCSALVDAKVKTRPVLYLPADLETPANLDAIAKRCRVDVHRLPQPIAALGELSPARLPVQGLLYLPHPYVVPGGFFNEMYGWDSYFIVLGLLADRRFETARDMVDNQLFEVAHYGGVLNANRSYYLTRSQPPFLSQMIRAVLDDKRGLADADTSRAWLERAYPLAVRDHDIWTRPEHRAGDTGLARYFDYGAGPVPEMQDSRYLRGAIQWLRAHADQDPGYLIKAPQHANTKEAEALAQSSCDVRVSRVCAGAWFGGYRLSADFYRGDRAMRESGFDTTFLFGPYAGSTHHYATVGLNSLLYRYEVDLADFAWRLGRSEDAQRWDTAAAARRAAMDRYLWCASCGMYYDYDVVAGKRSDYAFITAFYPLWAGAASPEQANAVRGQLGQFERNGGLMMSTRESGAQWDAPFGWAPTNWLAIAGLDAAGFHDDAKRVAAKFTGTIDRSLAADGTIREKYNMVSGDAKVEVKAGYTANVIGFGWSNGVYLKLQELMQR